MKLFLLFIISLFPITLYADEEGSCGSNTRYTYDESTNTLNILGEGDMSNFSMYGKDAPWYNYRTDIIKVVIKNGVSRIGNYAFCGCDRLVEVYIPNSVKSIGSDAFSACTGLTSLTIPSSVESIESYTFLASGLVSINIEHGVKYIKASAFRGCGKLTSLELPNSVISIGEQAFEYCTQLVNIVIPNSVTSIGGAAFHHCEKLLSIELPNSLQTIEQSTFLWCKKLSSISIPNSIKTIGSQAFYGCENLKSISIPNGVTSIGSSAFESCSHLKEVKVYSENPPKAYFNTFPNYNITLFVPRLSLSLYQNNSPWNNFNTIKELEEETNIKTNRVKSEYLNKIYSLEGKKKNLLQKGVKLIHKGDGRTIKIVVK